MTIMVFIIMIYDLWFKIPSDPKKGAVLIGRHSDLVKGDEHGATLSPAFVEYVRRRREESYLL